MPLDIGESINYLADSFLKAPIINTIASNPIYTAMVITFIIMLIVMVVFRSAETEDPMLRMILRCGFWVFLSTLTIVFLHDKILSKDTNAIKKDEAYNGIFNGGSDDLILEDAVIPKIKAQIDAS